MRAAVFLDRDGTLIELVHHLTDPADVKLMPGAAEAVKRLRQAGLLCVLVTNQSVIGRGLLTIEGLGAVHDELHKQLGEQGAALDGVYFCAEEPLQRDPAVVEHPDRKPGPGMLLRAATDLGIDLRRSWMVGDTISDVLAGRNAGCNGSILVRTGYGEKASAHPQHFDHVVEDFVAATDLILRNADPV